MYSVDYMKKYMANYFSNQPFNCLTISGLNNILTFFVDLDLYLKS